MLRPARRSWVALVSCGVGRFRSGALLIAWRIPSELVHSSVHHGGLLMCRTLSAITLACLLFGCAKKEEPTNPNPPVNPTPNPQPGPTRPSAKDPEPKTTPTPANSGP